MAAAIDAALALAAIDRPAGVLLADAPHADQISGALEATAVIVDTRAVLASLAERTRDLGAASHAGAATAELVGPTPAAGVGLARAVDAGKAIWAAVCRAVTHVAAPVQALLAGATRDVRARVSADTDIRVTGLAGAAGDLKAAVDAEVPGCVTLGPRFSALIVVALSNALPRQADVPRVAGLTLVDLEVAVVVDAIADLDQLTTRAEAAGISCPLIDAPIAVVVLGVAHFVRRRVVGHAVEETVDADLVPEPTRARLSSRTERRRDGLTRWGVAGLCARIAHAVSVRVRLCRVRDGRAVVTDIA